MEKLILFFLRNPFGEAYSMKKNIYWKNSCLVEKDDDKEGGTSQNAKGVHSSNNMKHKLARREE